MAGNVECEFKQYLIFEPGVQVTFSVLYTLIAGAGIAGNLMMIISTVRSQQLWVNTRLYLINMAVSDIIMCITTVPVTPYTAFTGKWVFGTSLCHLLPMIQLSRDGEREICSESWQGTYRLSFGILTLVLQFLLPATVRNRNVILLLMLMVFTLGWLPVNILNILEDLEVPLVCWPYYYFLFFSFHVVAMLTTCCNPLFYGWLSSTREEC